MNRIDVETLIIHQTHDAWWSTIAHLWDLVYDDINVPMLIISGWYDKETASKPLALEKLLARSHASVRDKHRMLFGPSAHAKQDELQQGQLTYPAAGGVAEARPPAFAGSAAGLTA